MLLYRLIIIFEGILFFYIGKTIKILKKINAKHQIKVVVLVSIQ